MQNRLHKSLALYGSIIFPYLNLCAKNVLKKTSKELLIITENGKEYFNFYGLKVLCISQRDYIFDELFKSNYDFLDEILKNEFDLFYERPYCDIYGKETTYRQKIYNKLWNELTLLEVAYLLNDDKAISILKKYKREIFYYMSSYNTLKKNKGKELAIKYNENNILDFY